MQTGGGAATAGGVDFQNRLAGWFAVQLLAEEDASLPWELPASCHIQSLHSEVSQPVDDVIATTSCGGSVFVQAKRTISLSEKDDSELASVFDQFVRQHLVWASASPGPGPWDRRLDPGLDRLVLAVGAEASRTISNDLGNVLQRIRQLPVGAPLSDLNAQLNQDDAKALRIAIAHVRKAWQVKRGVPATEGEVRAVLSLCWVREFRIEAGEPDEIGCKNLLRQAVLERPAQADAAWGLVLKACAAIAPTRSSVDLRSLRQVLLDANLQLAQPRSHREDIQLLLAVTARASAHLSRHARLETTSGIHIRREFQDLLAEAVEKDHLLLVGEPGAGKSGTVYELARTLQARSRHVVMLAADQVSAGSLAELRVHLGLRQELVDAIVNWDGAEPAFLIIDALDAAREEGSAQCLRDLISLLTQAKKRWRVVASVRKFDLRYGHEWQRLFRGDPIVPFADPEFSRVRHMNVPLLTDGELAQLQGTMPELHQFVGSAPPATQRLCRYAFNLRLVSELLAEGVNADHLGPIRTQRELLDRYWTHRVVRSDRAGDDRESLLRRACEAMVAARSLQIPRTAVVQLGQGPLMSDLLSSHTLVEVEARPGMVDRNRVSFSHHVLFDYAVSRLLFEPEPGGLPLRLRQDPDLAFVVRPSLICFFEQIWRTDPTRQTFWALTLEIMGDPTLPEIVKLLAPSVAARCARSVVELAPLTEQLRRGP